MVRFNWHVEDGCGAQILPGEMAYHPDTSVQHAYVDVEIPGHKQSVTLLFTIPKGYLFDEESQPVGVLIAHGQSADAWKSEFLTNLSVKLAQAGYLVVRYNCDDANEHLRQRVFEKAVDATATSPFGRCPKGWLLLGLGSGGRVAALVSSRCRPPVAGVALVDYPLKEPFTTLQGTGLPDSSGPLLCMEAPALFLQPSSSPACAVDRLKPLLPAMASPDVRYFAVQGADATFSDAADPHPPQAAADMLATAVIDFCWVLGEAERKQRAAKKAAKQQQQQQQQQQEQGGADGVPASDANTPETGNQKPPQQDKGADPMDIDGAAAAASGGDDADKAVEAESEPHVVTTQWQLLKGPDVQLPAANAKVAAAAAKAVAALMQEHEVMYDTDPWADVHDQ